MPYPFVLPTTSHLNFQNNFSSSTHPSLPSATTAERNVLRSALKSHKRLSTADQAGHISEVLSAIDNYRRHLVSIDYALSGKAVSGEDVDLVLVKDVELEWRPTLGSPSIPGRDVDRVKGQGLDYEFYFVHHTYAIIQNLLARQALLGLFATTTPSAEQRIALIQAATKHLKLAYAAHTCLVQRANSADGPSSFPATAIDVSPSVQTALQRLSQAEYNLLCVLKDDPYPAILVQSRNQSDREWMIKAPDIPKTRAQVLTRLCIGAAEHAAAASATLKGEGKRILKDLVEYVDDLKGTARARSCRFQAIDSDSRGQTGRGIAWLQAGLHELGIEVSDKDASNSKSSRLSKLKASWNERREDRRIDKKSARWGSDAGKAEEIRIIEYLERGMVKSNNAVNFQVVPEWKPLMNSLPSGMNMPIEDEKWKVLLLGEDELARMRAPPEDDQTGRQSSGDEEGENDRAESSGRAVGAFPGSEDQYKTSYF